MSICQAARKLCINYSTAKSILHLYKVKSRLGNDRPQHIDRCIKKRFECDQLKKVVQTEPRSFLDLLFQKIRCKAREELVEKEDAFTCLLYQQQNTVANKLQGFITKGHCGNILPPAVFNYSPQDFLLGCNCARGSKRSLLSEPT